MGVGHKRRKIRNIIKLNIFLFIILIICVFFYYRNETGPKAAGGFSDPLMREASQMEKSSADDFLNGRGILPADSGQSKAVAGDVYGEKPAESLELALYTELPYFIEENAGRYTDFKKRYPDYSYEKIITYVNIGLDREFYENVSVVDDADSITVLVNKYKKLPDDFEPELVQVEQSMCAPTVGPQYLRREAYEAFVKMREDAKQLGLNITVCSGYRSIRTQELIWNDALKRGRTLEDVDSSIARAGHSEHHTGLAIDVITAEYDVEKTKEFEWYSQNAYKYGFIIRYPKDKEHITGYKYEPWHLRYVGPEIAKEIYEKDITFDEYYVQVIQPGKSNGTGRGNRCCF